MKIHIGTVERVLHWKNTQVIKKHEQKALL